MPSPQATIEAVGLVLDIAGIGFSIYDLGDTQSTEEKLDALSRRIDRLQESVDELGESLLSELSVLRDSILLQLIEQSVQDAEAARGQLRRYQSVESPSEQARLDVIASAEQSFLRVVGQVRNIVEGASPESAIGFLGALAFSASIRLEVAHALEDGAMGADVLRQSLLNTADAMRGIADLMYAQLPEALDVSTTGSFRIVRFVNLDAIREARFVTTVFSPYTDKTYTETRVKIYNSNAEFQRYNFDLANHGNQFEPRLIARQVDEAADLLKVEEIRLAADQLAALGDGTQRTGTSGRDTIDGTDGNDLLIGLGGNDRLDGGDDGDVLYGGSGDDIVLGRGGHDVLDGASGSDTLRGDAGHDTLRGGTGNDMLLAHAGDDRLFGGNGKDYLDAGSGNDTLDGGAGVDTLIGGKGADVFVFSADPDTGRDIVRGFRSGQDRIELDGSIFSRLPSGVLPDGRLQFAPEAGGTSAKLLYHDGVLSYDPDGGGPQAPVEIARFVGSPDIAATDIFVF